MLIWIREKGRTGEKVIVGGQSLGKYMKEEGGVDATWTDSTNLEPHARKSQLGHTIHFGFGGVTIALF